MNAFNKRRNVEKDCGVYLMAAFIRGRDFFKGGVYSRAAFNDMFACPCGVHLREAFIRIITVC